MTDFEKVAHDFEIVTKMLQDFVQTFDIDYTCAMGSDFEAGIDNDCIYWAVAMPEKSALAFQENFVARFPACADFDLFTLSFIHELGHLETEWDMIDDVEERNTIKDNKNYFLLYNEMIATNWAGEYLTANHDMMKSWEKEILENLKKVLDKYPD